MTALKSQKNPQPLKNKRKILAHRLQLQLSHFGLNPNDWNLIFNSRIDEERQINVDLIHRSDQHYRLKGTAQVVKFSPQDLATSDELYTAFWREIQADLKL